MTVSANDFRSDVSVVGGAGHVGIPLVLSFAATGMRVLVNDLNQTAMDQLLAGRLPFVEYGAQSLLDDALRQGKILCSRDPAHLSHSDAVIITIGTPVDEHLNPVHKVMKQCIDDLLPHLVDGQLLILRSTVYPGTTKWLSGHLSQLGRRLRVAFCPERIVQGYGVAELKSTPQIVSGTSPEAEEAAAALFARIAPEIVRVKPLEAEFAKLFCNAYRYIEFATTNQFYMLAESAGADYNGILKAMKHNYPRLQRIPGPGFTAGPCLLKDTMQLAVFSRNQFSLGHAAMLVNEGLVLFVVDKLRKLHPLGDAVIGLLGMAFKAEVDDTRASLSYKLKKTLILETKEVLLADPFVRTDPEIIPVDEVVARSDVLVLCTPHNAYRNLDLKGKPVVDVWNFFGGRATTH
jgi:UDP-N-acetyl-D-mannosaminuronic acid dehydrogenase